MGEIDHEYTDVIVCPWCGCKHEDCHEIHDDCCHEIEYDCNRCGKRMTVNVEYKTEYCTEKVED